MRPELGHHSAAGAGHAVEGVVAAGGDSSGVLEGLVEDAGQQCQVHSFVTEQLGFGLNPFI